MDTPVGEEIDNKYSSGSNGLLSLLANNFETKECVDPESIRTKAFLAQIERILERTD